MLETYVGTTPVSIPLGNSGLGIYGFLGLFAMHYARDETGLENDAVPALTWLKNRANGNPTNIAAWKPNINHWAFGVGAVLGTIGTNVIFNLKGVLLLELPGPRILLMMKARLLYPMPELGDKNAEGNLLAVIDLDAAKGTLTIGIVADYTIDPLIKIRIPVEAFFRFDDSSDWHIYLGKFEDPIQATILGVVDGSGYLMISGKGLDARPSVPLPGVSGLAIGTGLRASLVWGSVPVRLYVRVVAGFDAVVGFEPFRLAGKLYVRGELVLFIISIDAWADLSVDVGEEILPNGLRNKISRIDGEICGEIDFFFFSIKGCVGFHLGASNVPELPSPPLIKDLKLISRSPALVVGTGVDRGIDTGIGTAVQIDTEPMPNVPIDSIPVLMMSSPPIDDNLKVFGKTPLNHPGAKDDGWVQRGRNWYHYELKTVDLVGEIGAGDTPSIWWTPFAPTADNNEVQLALLSWVPNATPKAFTRSKFLEENIEERWGTVCYTAAPATSVLWTFSHEPLGKSPIGWELEGAVWPDPPGTVRSLPPDLKLQITERWRSGIDLIDRMRGIVPAEVVGLQVRCPGKNDLKLNKTAEPKATTALSAWSAAVASIALNREHDARGLEAIRREVDSIAGRKMPEKMPSVVLSAQEVLARLEVGGQLSRADLLAATMGKETQLAATSSEVIKGKELCDSRVLASPMMDDGNVIIFGNQNDEKEVLQAWKEIEFEPSKLGNSVILHSGECEVGRLLLFALTTLVREKRLVVRQLDRAGNVVAEQFATSADIIPAQPIPSEWINPNGPWYYDVANAIAYVSRLNSLGTSTLMAVTTQSIYVPVILEIKGDPKAVKIELGIVRSENKDDSWRFMLRPFYLAVIELMRGAEVRRRDYDKKTVTRNQGAVEAAFSSDASDFALLKPGKVYQVRTAWEVKHALQDNRPDTAQTNSLAAETKNATFWFRTDVNPPKRLEPWVLVTLPGEGEKHVFCADKLSVIFGTNQVVKLYEEYGKRLQARIKAASYRRSASTVVAPHPFPISGMTAQPIRASVLSPWEETMGDLLADKPCIPMDGSRIRHTRIDIPITLDPYTDYLLDIEMVNTGAAPDAVGEVVLSHSFSSGAFQSISDFATAFLSVRPEHRYVNSGITALKTQFSSRAPEGAELDTALAGFGIEPMGAPQSPRVVALWEQSGSTPVPVAVIVDSPEPLLRTRMLPFKIVEPTADHPSRFELKPREWLTLGRFNPSAPLPPSDDIIDAIIMAPGNQRAIVLLKSGSRGKRLQLGLVHKVFTEEYLDGSGAVDTFYKIAFVSLLAAPWEEI